MTYIIAEPRVEVVDRASRGAQSTASRKTDTTKTTARAVVALQRRRVAFFAATLPGRDVPLDSPDGAAKLGALGVDSPHVTGLPPQGLGM